MAFGKSKPNALLRGTLAGLGRNRCFGRSRISGHQARQIGKSLARRKFGFVNPWGERCACFWRSKLFPYDWRPETNASVRDKDIHRWKIEEEWNSTSITIQLMETKSASSRHLRNALVLGISEKNWEKFVRGICTVLLRNFTNSKRNAFITSLFSV